MRTLGKIAATMGVIGAIAAISAVPASADWYGRHHHELYNYYGGDGGDYGRVCRRGWSLQGGVCKPYHFGPWDRYNYGYERR